MHVFILGSYFYFIKSDILSETWLLQFPVQKYVTELSFAYYITGIVGLQVVQLNVATLDINHTYSLDGTGQWERASVSFTNSDTDYGIVIASRDLEGEVVGEAAIDGPSVVALDDIVVTMELPCNYSALSAQGGYFFHIIIAMNVYPQRITVISLIMQYIFMYALWLGNIPL